MASTGMGMIIDKSLRPGSRRGLYVALWLAVLVSTPLLVLLLSGADLLPALRYDREAVLEHGQWWRLLSGQWSHVGWQHGLLNLATWLLLCLYFVPTLGAGRSLILLAGGVAGTAAGLLLSPALQWYAGLSGALHGMVGGVALLWLHRQRWLAVTLLVLLVAKLTGEQLLGPLSASGLPDGVRVITEAHLWGAIAGMLAGLFVSAYDSRSRCV